MPFQNAMLGMQQAVSAVPQAGIAGETQGLQNAMNLQTFDANQQAMQNKKQARNALAAYYGADNPQEREMLLNQLATVSPETAQRVQSLEQNQLAVQSAQQQIQAAEQQFVQQEAEQVYLGAQYVLNSQDPVAALQLVGTAENDPVQELIDSGVIESVDDLTPELARQVAEEATVQAGPVAGIVPGQGEQFTLSPGQVRFNAQGQPIAGVDPSAGNMQRVSAIVQGEDTPSMLNYDPESGTYTRQTADGTVQQIPSSQITEVSVQGGAEDVIPATRRDDLIAQRDWLNFQRGEIDRMTNIIQNDPTIAGAGGTLRRLGQDVIGAATSLADLFGELGASRASEMIVSAEQNAARAVDQGLMEESQFDRLFNDPALSELALFENTLGFTLAQLRTEDGRLLSPVINRSMEDARLTGLSGADEITNKLGAVQRQIDARLNSLNDRLGIEGPDPVTMSDDELVDFYLNQ